MFLLGVVPILQVGASAASAESAAAQPVTSFAGTCTDEKLEATVISEITSSLGDSTIDLNDLCIPRELEDVKKAMGDFSPGSQEKGMLAWNFLKNMARSKTFVEEYWHKRPLLIRAENTGGWIEDCFTIDRDLR